MRSSHGNWGSIAPRAQYHVLLDFKMADEVVKKKTKKSSETLALDADKQKEFEEKVKSLKSKGSEELIPGVMYLGHIPHGFYENEIRGFFSQFGTVNKVRVSRSKKTTRSKGYAFIEFACDEVAKIAAETMHNYMMFGRLLKSKVVPNDRIHPRLWEGSNRKFRYIPKNKNATQKHNKPRTQGEHESQVNNLLKRENRKRKKLQELGIEYDFPGYTAEAKTHSAKHTRF